MDVAINGKGFITVMAPDGTEAYTREGDLQVTADGAVITANGLPVMSEQGLVNVPAATSVTIGSDGTVSVVPLGLTPVAQSQVDRIKLVNPNTADLKKGPDGLFRLKSGGKSPTDETVTLQSGMLEMSNVNAANSLVNMIELQRLYEFQIKSMNSTDQNEQTAERLMMSTS
jgi:flagellar basal-body rod protein FlgF